MSATSPDSEERIYIILGDDMVIVPPPGWSKSVSLEGTPLRLHDHGEVTFRPPDASDVTLTWRVVNWLEGREEWRVFRDVLDRSGALDREDLRFLYPELIRVPIEYIFQCEVAADPSLGKTLEIRYAYPDQPDRGVILYGLSPTGENDVLMLSYKGTKPAFDEHVESAIESMNSMRRVKVRG